MLFGAGLIFLWVAVELIPVPTRPDPASVVVDDAGAVATSISGLDIEAREPRLFTYGNLAAIMLLAGGIAVAVFLHRRYIGKETSGSILQSVTKLSLGPNQQLRLVICGDDIHLLGITSSQITVLKTYPRDTFESDGLLDELAGQAYLGTHDNFQGSRAGFGDILRQYAGRYVNTQQTGTPC